MEACTRKQVSQGKTMKGEEKESLNTYEILKEALRVTILNGRHVLCIMLLMMYYYMPLALGMHHTLALIFKIQLANCMILIQDVNSSAADFDSATFIYRDLLILLAFVVIVLAYSISMLLFSLVTTVIATHEAHTRKVMPLKDMLMSINGKWGRPISTLCFTAFITVLGAIQFQIMLGIISEITRSFPRIILIILGILYFSYLAALWMLSLVVSVLEEDTGGLKAIARANELMRGKRIQGCSLMLLVMLAYGTISIAAFLILEKATTLSRDTTGTRLLGIVLVGLGKVSTFVLYTIFYHACKKN